jgi:hypothetical protein
MGMNEQAEALLAKAAPTSLTKQLKMNNQIENSQTLMAIQSGDQIEEKDKSAQKGGKGGAKSEKQEDKSLSLAHALNQNQHALTLRDKRLTEV